MVPGSLGCGSVVFAAMTMFAPSRAARSAMAWPMPRLAPVMKSVFPLSVDMADKVPANPALGEDPKILGGRRLSPG